MQSGSCENSQKLLDYFFPQLYMTCAVPVPKLWSAHFKAYSPTKESPVTSSTDARKTMVNGVKLLSVTHKSRATLFDKHCAIMLEVRKGILVCSVSEALSGGWMQVNSATERNIHAWSVVDSSSCSSWLTGAVHPWEPTNWLSMFNVANESVPARTQTVIIRISFSDRPSPAQLGQLWVAAICLGTAVHSANWLAPNCLTATTI